jgi:hypothetical protein
MNVVKFERKIDISIYLSIRSCLPCPSLPAELGKMSIRVSPLAFLNFSPNGTYINLF